MGDAFFAFCHKIIYKGQMINTEQKINTIFVVDDEVSSWAAKYIDRVFPGTEIIEISSTDGIVEALESGAIPDIMFTDCTSIIGYDFGLQNAKALIKWLKQNEPNVALPGIAFMSATSERAFSSARHLTSHYQYQGVCYGIDKNELPTVADIVIDRILDFYDDLSDGFKELLTDYGIDLLTISDETHNYLENTDRNPEEIVAMAKHGIFDRDDVLAKLRRDATSVMSRFFVPKADIEERDGWEEINNLSVCFNEAAGQSVVGYAAFSKEEVEALASEGKKSVLFMEQDASYYIPLLNHIAGVVMLDPDAAAHMKIILDSHGVAGALGMDDLSEEYPFLKDPSGKPLKYGKVIKEQDGKKVFVDYEKAIRKLAEDHIELQGSGEPYDASEIPDLIIDVNALDVTSVTTIEAGEQITLDVDKEYDEVSIYPMPLPIRTSATYQKYYPWVLDVDEMIDEWHQDNDITPMPFKAVIDGPRQGYRQHHYMDGIGLVRTEHFILSHEISKQAYKSAVLNQDGDSLDFLRRSLANDFGEVIRFADKDFPVRVRLVDLPLDETKDVFSEEEREQITSKYGVDNTRGVQLAQKIPAIYEAQIRGIFDAVKEKRLEDPDWQFIPEIMPPTIRSYEELMFVKNMIAEIAREYGYDESDYKFGSMVEMLGACKDIRRIAKECAFLSIGSNDLSSEKLDYSRGDYEKRRKIKREFGEEKDPTLMLYDPVIDLIYDIADQARDANPKIKIEICGDHANDLNSLEALRDLELDGVSVTASEQSLRGLRMLYKYQTFHLHNRANDNEPAAQENVDHGALDFD